jgi:hypothetical protein
MIVSAHDAILMTDALQRSEVAENKPDDFASLNRTAQYPATCTLSAQRSKATKFAC